MIIVLQVSNINTLFLVKILQTIVKLAKRQQHRTHSNTLYCQKEYFIFIVKILIKARISFLTIGY